MYKSENCTSDTFLKICLLKHRGCLEIKCMQNKHNHRNKGFKKKKKKKKTLRTHHLFSTSAYQMKMVGTLQARLHKNTLK